MRCLGTHNLGQSDLEALPQYLVFIDRKWREGGNERSVVGEPHCSRSTGGQRLSGRLACLRGTAQPHGVPCARAGVCVCDEREGARGRGADRATVAFPSQKSPWCTNSIDHSASFLIPSRFFLAHFPAYACLRPCVRACVPGLIQDPVAPTIMSSLNKMLRVSQPKKLVMRKKEKDGSSSLKQALSGAKHAGDSSEGNRPKSRKRTEITPTVTVRAREPRHCPPRLPPTLTPTALGSAYTLRAVPLLSLLRARLQRASSTRTTRTTAMSPSSASWILTRNTQSCKHVRAAPPMRRAVLPACFGWLAGTPPFPRSTGTLGARSTTPGPPRLPDRRCQRCRRRSGRCLLRACARAFSLSPLAACAPYTRTPRLIPRATCCEPLPVLQGGSGRYLAQISPESQTRPVLVAAAR